ncbi:GHKL domain-containing protein [Clostridium perfringens]
MSELKLIKVDDIELSIILNNLLNNAIEAVEFLEERKISLKILENENYEIIIKNSIKEDKQIDFIKLFKKGYSTKGKNRGVGLYNIKDIVNRYNGQLNLINKNKYLIISIIFKK